MVGDDRVAAAADGGEACAIARGGGLRPEGRELLQGVLDSCTRRKQGGVGARAQRRHRGSTAHPSARDEAASASDGPN